MPFKSEKQRRYLWANEPEIARDWTDTYGSRIKKDDGGISQLVKPGIGRPGYRGDDARKSAAAMGKGAMGTAKHGGGDDPGPSGLEDIGNIKKYTGPDQKEKAKKKAEKKSIKSQIKQYLYRPNKAKVKGYHQDYKNYLSELGVTNIPSTLDEENPFGFWESDAYNYEPTVSHLPHIEKPSNVLNYGDWMATYKGAPNIKHSGDIGNLEKYVTEKDPITGRALQYGYRERPGEGGIDPHVFRNRGLTQGGGGGGGTTAATTTTPSAFQESLTTGVNNPFDYYVGEDPTAANLAWGEKFGVDPRTMYKTSWADGGRIPAAYGGIMDTETGRRAYGLGSIFKKIGRAAKKVLKSPIGKAALMYGLGTGLGSFMPGGAGTGFGRFALGNAKQNLGALFMRSKAPKSWEMGDEAFKALPWYKKINPWTGIAAASALPFFMGGKEEDEDEKFDYDAAKNAYAQEMMRIKAGAMAGTLDPTKFRYLGVKDGGRAGYYAGGQSVPSDYTMEDAMMTTTQDKLGGITDVMKQADLNRQGSVGQFYAENGGPAEIGGDNISKILARVKELQDEGLDLGSAMAQAIKELKQNKAEGGRIGLKKGSRKESLSDKLTRWAGGPSMVAGDLGFEGLHQIYNLLGMGGLYAQGGRIGYRDAGDVKVASDPGMGEGPFMYQEYLDAVRDGFKGSYDEFIDQIDRSPWDYAADGGRIGYAGGSGNPPITTGQVPQAPGRTPPPAQRPNPMPAPQPNRMRGMPGGMNPMMNPMMNSPMMNRPMMNPMGGRRMAQEGGLMDLGGMEKDYRNDGGFVPLGGEEKADDVPARLSKNEFVFTADAVRGAGDGDIDKGAEIMENIMKNLEQGGQISEETQGLTGAQEMFGVSERLSEVV